MGNREVKQNRTAGALMHCYFLTLSLSLKQVDFKPTFVTIQMKCLISTMYERKVYVDMLNAVKSVLADVSSVSPSSEQRGDYGLGESLYRMRVH